MLARKRTSEQQGDNMTFADFIKTKRTEKGFTLRGFAEALDIAPSYVSDIEKEKRNAPTQEILEKMVEILQLSYEEKNEMFDLAAQNKEVVAKDITDYINANSTVRVALRRAKELNLSNKEWIKIIEELENKK